MERHSDKSIADASKDQSENILAQLLLNIELTKPPYSMYKVINLLKTAM